MPLSPAPAAAITGPGSESADSELDRAGAGEPRATRRVPPGIPDTRAGAASPSLVAVCNATLAASGRRLAIAIGLYHAARSSHASNRAAGRVGPIRWPSLHFTPLPRHNALVVWAELLGRPGASRGHGGWVNEIVVAQTLTLTCHAERRTHDGTSQSVIFIQLRCNLPASLLEIYNSDIWCRPHCRSPLTFKVDKSERFKQVVKLGRTMNAQRYVIKFLS